jgi:hypothetical protein
MSILIKNKSLTVADATAAAKLQDVLVALSAIDATLQGSTPAVVVNAATTQLMDGAIAIMDQSVTAQFESSLYGGLVTVYGSMTAQSDKDCQIVVQFSPDGTMWFDSDEVVPILSGVGGTVDFNRSCWTASKFVRCKFVVPAAALVQPKMALFVSARA